MSDKMVDFVHVGIQKTGSTWLQNGIFEHHPDLEVFGHLVKGHRLKKLGYLVPELYSPDFSKEEWLESFKDHAVKLRNDKTIGMSNEQLAGHMFDTYGGLEVADRLNVKVET